MNITKEDIIDGFTISASVVIYYITDTILAYASVSGMMRI